MSDNPLGKTTTYPGKYQPDLLVRIPRNENRDKLGLKSGRLPFTGADIWNAYEISCLDHSGRPRNFIGRFVIPANSANLVESKSLKLYLNSFNQEQLASAAALTELLVTDLSAAAGTAVEVAVFLPEEAMQPELPAGTCLDSLEVTITDYAVNPALLKQDQEVPFEEIVDEVLFTNLFRSNCPITNQPDWATVTVCYHGRKIPGKALLKYLVSYRQHNDYHENCVERIFCDLQEAWQPQSLTVEANFLRRGGLDINPVRSTEPGLNYRDFPRYIRQ